MFRFEDTNIQYSWVFGSQFPVKVKGIHMIVLFVSWGIV